MEEKQLIDSFIKLKKYCENEQYKGWDPYDGLNSHVFKAFPYFKNKSFWRLCVIQGFKRCPVNLRKIALVPKEYNAKGIGLFVQGYCNLIKVVRKKPELANIFGSEEVLKAKLHDVASLLINLQSKGYYHGACWGYNFDWQARGGLFFPAYTPTVVATNFCATALMAAYEVTGKKEYLDIALSSAKFVLKDLHTKEYEKGIIFSYSPLQGNDTVFNASLLGSRLLSYCYHYNRNEEFKAMDRKSVVACCAGQNDDGSWVYGMLPIQSWIDSFHTGYNLDGLIAYEELTGDKTFHHNIEKGFDFYIRNFFEDDGTPKYYHNKMYPIDIHCPGQLFVTLNRLHKFAEYKDIAEKVLSWTIENMQDQKGFFYYQFKNGINSKIPYMRWSNAFMFNSMSYYINSICKTVE